MAIPTYQQLMLPMLRIVAQSEISLPDLVRKLSTEFNLSPEEAATLNQSGQAVIYNRTGWAKTEMVKAGLLTQPERGVIRITDRGLQLLASPPPQITRPFLMERFPEFRAFIEASQRRSSAAGPAQPDLAEAALADTAATPDDQLDAAFKSINAALESELLIRVRRVDPSRFEQIVVDLLIAMGFGGGDPEMGKRLGRTGDGGIDGVIQEDALGLDAVYVQAKRYAEDNTIGAPRIREFYGSLEDRRATKGVFVTTSSYSGEAKAFAERATKRIVLIDGVELARLLLRHNVGVQKVREITIKKLDLDYLENAE